MVRCIDSLSPTGLTGGTWLNFGGVRSHRRGTKEELVTACKTAKEHGIVIYIGELRSDCFN